MKKSSVKLITLLLLCAVVLGTLASCGIVVSDEYKFGLATVEGDGTQIAAAVIIDSSERIALVKIDEFDEAKEASKKDLGDKYGMLGASYGSELAEWDDQIAHLERYLLGKKVSDLSGINADDADLKAGCTVYTGNYIAAVLKAAEAAKEADGFKSTEDHLALTLSIAYDKIGANSEPAIAVMASALSRGYIADKAAVFCGAIPRECRFGLATVKTNDGKVAAAVITDADNRIVCAFIDEFDNSKGDSKKKLGDEYGMVKYGDAKTEWYEQIEYLEKSLVGKNIEQVSTVKKGDADLVGGCTVAVDNYVKAVVKAMNNAKNATAFSALVSEVEIELAFDAEKVGEKYEIDVTAEAYASGKKVDEQTEEHTDLEELRFGFAATDAAAMVSAAVVIDDQGRVVAVKIDEFDTSKGHSKKALGDAYGMLGAAWGSQLAEWDDQITFLENYFIGKSAAEIAPVKKGDADLEGGCTVGIDAYVAAVVSAIEAAEASNATVALRTDLNLTLSITAANGATTATASATADSVSIGSGAKTSVAA